MPFRMLLLSGLTLLHAIPLAMPAGVDGLL